jgi:hypothetical protein
MAFLSENNMTYYKPEEMLPIDHEILSEAKKLGFTTKDFGDTYVGSQRQITDLVKRFLNRYADDGK